jgi:hypothetical protein
MDLGKFQSPIPGLFAKPNHFALTINEIYPAMLKKFIFLSGLLTFTVVSYGQDNGSDASSMDFFKRATTAMKSYKLDTSSAPDDKITRKIIELRKLRGGFNINEAISFKIGEEREKDEKPKEELDKIAAFFKEGNGKRWLDNAAIWIYRNHFTYRELKKMTKFYRSSAGQKMAEAFPMVMLQSLAAGELIMAAYMQQLK